jgi:hypothetical protein
MQIAVTTVSRHNKSRFAIYYKNLTTAYILRNRISLTEFIGKVPSVSTGSVGVGDADKETHICFVDLRDAHVALWMR